MSLDFCATELRQHDYARYVIPLLLPHGVRAKLWALYAFNLELSRVPVSAREPMLQRIRYQWWREAIERMLAGNPDKHPVVQCLGEYMGTWAEAAFEELIAAHENGAETTPILEKMTKTVCNTAQTAKISRIFKVLETVKPDTLLPLRLWFKTFF